VLELELFSHRNFAAGNLETLCVYAGLAILFFYLTIYLQQVAGYSALESGTATLPVTLAMFTQSRRFGALADRLGPRLFMGGGPLVAATEILPSPGSTGRSSRRRSTAPSPASPGSSGSPSSILACAALAAAGGAAGAIGIVNPKRTVEATKCAGGQLVGAPAPAAVGVSQGRGGSESRS
jgi:hypothetical protein